MIRIIVLPGDLGAGAGVFQGRNTVQFRHSGRRVAGGRKPVLSRHRCGQYSRWNTVFNVLKVPLGDDLDFHRDGTRRIDYSERKIFL